MDINNYLMDLLTQKTSPEIQNNVVVDTFLEVIRQTNGRSESSPFNLNISDDAIDKVMGTNESDAKYNIKNNDQVLAEHLGIFHTAQYCELGCYDSHGQSQVIDRNTINKNVSNSSEKQKNDFVNNEFSALSHELPLINSYDIHLADRIVLNNSHVIDQQEVKITQVTRVIKWGGIGNGYLSQFVDSVYKNTFDNSNVGIALDHNSSEKAKPSKLLEFRNNNESSYQVFASSDLSYSRFISAFKTVTANKVDKIASPHGVTWQTAETILPQYVSFNGASKYSELRVRNYFKSVEQTRTELDNLFLKNISLQLLDRIFINGQLMNRNK